MAVPGTTTETIVMAWGGGGGKKSSKSYVGTFRKEKVEDRYLITLELEGKKKQVLAVDYSSLGKKSLQKLASLIDKKCDVRASPIKSAGEAKKDEKGREMIRLIIFTPVKESSS